MDYACMKWHQQSLNQPSLFSLVVILQILCMLNTKELQVCA